jgi:hypothetical protein
MENPDSRDVVDGTLDEHPKAQFVRATKTSITLARLGYEVCEHCGWTPITKRLDSHGEFGTGVRPLNWYSPIDTDSGKKLITTSKCETREMTIYRKAVTEVVIATSCLVLDDVESRDSRSNVGTIHLA